MGLERKSEFFFFGCVFFSFRPPQRLKNRSKFPSPVYLAGELLDELLDRRDARRAADHDDLVEVGELEAGCGVVVAVGFLIVLRKEKGEEK